MMKPSLNLCFFWHMHQPDYRNSEGVMSMPWVFLHAIKDYYEMPWLLSKYEGLKATFNITAPLIEQINLYADPTKNDYFLSLWIKEPQELSSDERSWLIKTCKSTQYETMIKPIESLATLYHKELMSDAELIDFELLFMLAWCGNYLRQENAVVKRFFKKGKGFSQQEKIALLESLRAFVKTILPFYAKLAKKGVISLSTTPYNHPILPLLLNMENAKIANEQTTLPSNPLRLQEDAIEQVERAIALYEETFKIKPTGFWPAEGAVDEESVGIYKERGIKWIATDEAILFKSLKDDNRTNLYNNYHFNDVTIGFRDHGLSDLIGFNYRFKSGDDASEHFMKLLQNITNEQKNPTVFVILDGENAWEFFENNAYDFFTNLYAKFQRSEWCHTVSMDDVAAFKESQKLNHLAPGSWIHGNFDTWSGHSEKNRAWELIYQTKRDVENATFKPSLEDEKIIKYHFLAAECSDWFWWYGDDHVTEFSYEFDALFREHLITIYKTLKMQAPTDLYEPILTHKSNASFLVQPKSFISPTIDEKKHSFFEWVGAGIIDETKVYSTMDKVRGPIEKILFGHNEEKLFFALSGEIKSLNCSNLTLLIIIEENQTQLQLAMNKNQNDNGIELYCDEAIELSISRSLFKEFDVVHLRLEIVEEDEIIQAMPGFGPLEIDLNEKYLNNWFV